MWREWQFYITDMITFSQNVLDYTAESDRNKFETNRLIYDATLRNLELIGEAATHIPADVRNKYPNIEWRKMIALRNRLIHAYLGLDNDILWDIVQNDIPKLLQALKDLSNAKNPI
jgi:uncharacterized protein with HEPN domain